VIQGSAVEYAEVARRHNFQVVKNQRQKYSNLRLKIRSCSFGVPGWFLVIDSHVLSPRGSHSILRGKKPRDDFGRVLDILQIDKFFLAVDIAFWTYHTMSKCSTSPLGNNVV